MLLIDTHCHLDSPQFKDDLPQLLDQARTVGIQSFIVPGITADKWPNLMSLCQQEMGLYAAPGIHPLFAQHQDVQDLDLLAKISQNENVVAIGEIGLDFFDTSIDHKLQQDLFEKQLSIARDAHLPILLHVRKAHDQVLATLRRRQFRNGGIVHAFSGSYQQACQYCKLGFVIGIGGTITYTRATKTRKIAHKLPTECIVIETDAPDMVTASNTGTTNFPEYLPEVLKALAHLRNEDYKETAKYTTSNAMRVLSL